ncbi:MAG: hypothetical protein GY748_25965 [Planctomycetaceae bacterium]|nr:hypothetical protein [Planctomycetaceae bacterium]
MNEEDNCLEHWNQAERDKIREEVSDVILKWTAEAKSLNAREVLFESYLACVWLSAEISAFTYKDFLEYVADINGRYIEQFHENLAKLEPED